MAYRYDWTQLAENLKRYQSIRKVAKLYGCDRRTIQRYLRNAKIPYCCDRINCADWRNHLGRIAELDALKILTGSIDVTVNDISAPYDLLWKEYRINVKSCGKPTVFLGKYSFWHFDIRGKDQCDYLFCMAYQNQNLVTCYLIPSDAPELPKASLFIPTIKRNKFSKYEFPVDKSGRRHVGRVPERTRA